MTALTCYRPEEVLPAVKLVSEDLAARRISAEEAANRLEPLVFRDSVGKWWTVGVRSLRWYRHAERGWEVAQAPPHRLEGLAGLVSQGLPETPEPTPPEKGRSLKATQAITAFMHEIRERYEQGLIHSDSVQELVSSQYLVDRAGQVWTLGFQTRGWFFFNNRGWQPSDDPPDPAQLLSREHTVRACPECQKNYPREAEFCPQCGGRLQVSLDLTQSAAENLRDFLEHGSDTLPEPVVKVWLPPEELPENPHPEEKPPEACACGCAFPPDARFCPQCGQKKPVPRPENCASCGQKLLPDARFCAYCGQPIGV